MTGPWFTKNLAAKWDGDIKIMAGIARAYTPKLVYHAETILNNNQSFAFAWNAGLGLRYSLSDKTILSIKTDQTQLKPKFKAPPSEKGKGEQHIVVINSGLGTGIKF